MAPLAHACMSALYIARGYSLLLAAYRDTPSGNIMCSDIPQPIAQRAHELFASMQSTQRC
eukprot:12808062-Alexandrium_andersonii.AAC.1